MNILISGAASLIGCTLIEELLKNSDNHVIATVRPNSSSNVKLERFKSQIEIIELDLEDLYKLPNYVSSIDSCIHLAWRGSRGKARLDEALQEKNYQDTLRFINAIIPLGLKHLIGVGSQAEYGITLDNVDEESIPHPDTAYGVYKLKTYDALNEITKKNNIDFKWARLYSVYGVGDLENTLFSYCLRQMKEDLIVEVGPCTQKWNFTNAIDVVKIFVRLLDAKIPGGIYIVSNSDTRVLKEFVLSMKEVLASNSEIHFASSDVTPMNLNPNNKKLVSALKDYKFLNFEEYIASIK